MISYKSDVEAVDAFVEKYDTLRAEIAKVIVGQDEVVKRVLISIFSRGHGLLVGVPGLVRRVRRCGVGPADRTGRRGGQTGRPRCRGAGRGRRRPRARDCLKRT